MALVVPAVFGGAAWLAAAVLRELGPMAYVVGGAVLLSTTFAVRGLGQAGPTTRRAVEKGDRLAARASLRNLVSRDARDLTEPLTLMAAIESVAENTTDTER